MSNPPSSVYTKGQVDRAGQRLRDSYAAFREDRHAALVALERGDLDDDLALVDAWRREHARPLSRVNAGLRHYIRKTGAAGPVVSQRLKRLNTIIDKLDRQPRMNLSRMEDIGGVRVILPRQPQVDRVVADLQRARAWKIRRVRRYLDGADPGPKPDGYRAIHVVVVKDDHFVEVQFRTPWQDAWAQSVEQDTRRLGAGLKFGSGPADLLEYYRLSSELMSLHARNLTPSKVLMGELAKSYAATRRYFADRPDDEGAVS